MSNLPHSPAPWKIVRYHVPYYDWIMDAAGVWNIHPNPEGHRRIAAQVLGAVA